MSGVTALADAIPGMGVLMKFDISNNLLYAAGAKALAEAFSGNQLMTELNVASNRLGEASYGTPDMSGVVTLAGIIKDMGALLVLNLASNSLGEMVPPKGWTKHWSSEIEGKYQYVYTHTNGTKQAKEPGSKPEGIIALASAIPDMRALSSLVLKDNKLLTAEAGKVLSDMLATNTVLKVLDLSSNNWNQYSDKSGSWLGYGPGFAKELAVGISGNGALTTLDISSNSIPSEQKKEIQRICAAGGIGLAS
jgi:hypothetical protein